MDRAGQRFAVGSRRAVQTNAPGEIGVTVQVSSFAKLRGINVEEPLRCCTPRVLPECAIVPSQVDVRTEPTAKVDEVLLIGPLAIGVERFLRRIGGHKGVRGMEFLDLANVDLGCGVKHFLARFASTARDIGDGVFEGDGELHRIGLKASDWRVPDHPPA